MQAGAQFAGNNVGKYERSLKFSFDKNTDVCGSFCFFKISVLLLRCEPAGKGYTVTKTFLISSDARNPRAVTSEEKAPLQM